MAQFLPASIRETRDAAVRPAEGLRFGNFGGVVALPSVGPSHKAGQHLKSYFNNLQIYHKICEWFESWMPWQRRMLLCGLTDRCSNYQLEYLSTALEPVFHRDYITALRGRYPTKQFEKPKEDKKEDLKPCVKPTRKAPVVKTEVKRPTETSQTERERRLSTFVNEYVDGILSDAYSTITISQDLDQSEEEKFLQETGKYAKELVQSIIDKASQSVEQLKVQDGSSSEKSGEEDRTMASTSKQAGSRRETPARESSSRKEKKIDQFQTAAIIKRSAFSPRPPSESRSRSRLSEKELESAVGNLRRLTSSGSIRPRSRSSPHSLSQSLNEPLSPTKLNSSRADKTRHWSFDVNRPVGKLFSEPRASPLDPLDELLYSNIDDMYNPFTNGNMRHRSSLIATPMSIFSHGPTQHSHRSTFSPAHSVDSADFFDKRKIQKLGVMRGSLRTGQIKKPGDVTDVHLPLQKSFKNEKWWGEELLTGKHLIRAHKNKLKHQFQIQLTQIWEWMEEWEDFERGDLLVEIIKLSNDEMIKFFAQCLVQRLRDRTNIDCLPDKAILRVFTFLQPLEINTAAQVCRRWRYIAAQDELWCTKCEEMGSREGVQDVTRMVERFKRDYSIDWRVAYQELIKVAHHAKDSSSYYTDGSYGDDGSLTERRRKPKKLLGFRLDDLQLKPGSPISTRADAESSESSDSHDETRISRGSQVVELPLQHINYLATLAGQDLAKPTEEAADEQPPVQQLPTQPPAQAPSDKDSSESEIELFFDEDNRRSIVLVRHTVTLPTPPSSGWYSIKLPFPHPPTSQGSKRTLYSRKTAKYSERRASTRDKKSRPTTEDKTLQEEAVEELGEMTKQDGEGLLKEMKKSRKKKRKVAEEEDTALDIRPELQQATDILGKAISDHRLEWRKDDGKTVKHTKFAGMVKGVKRVRKLQGHMDCVHCIAFDNRRIVSGSLDRTIRVWDIRSGRSIRKMYGHKGGIRCIQFDNDRIISGSWDMTLMVWDIVKFNRLAVLTGHKGSISALRFNSTHLVSASHDKTVRVWCLDNYACLNILRGHTDAVTCVSFDGTLAVSGSTDKTIRVSNIFSGECLVTLTGHTEPITAIEVQRDLVISGTLSGVVYFWNRETGEVEAGIKMHEACINKIVFLPVGPSGTRYLTASNDSVIKEWDLNTMTCVRQLHGHRGPVRDVQITDDRLVSCSDDGNIRIWDLMTPLLKPPDESHGKTIPMQTIKQGEDD
ncbi:uncharacterized protein [Ptychodera flava]|uniref:uncharacterized protein isoform X3 n=1 Tax=Ptychodera flava TaxID=63121 RepID=UPI00396A5E3A